MDELKPCPFCGGKAASFSEYTSEKYEGKNIWRAWVGCSDPYCPMGIGFEVSGEGDSWCDGSGYDKYSNPAPKLKAKAEKLWNRRAAPENKALTCEGCVNENNDAAQCESCIRALATNPDCPDNYARKPEGSETL